MPRSYSTSTSKHGVEVASAHDAPSTVSLRFNNLETHAASDLEKNHLKNDHYLDNNDDDDDDGDDIDLPTPEAKKAAFGGTVSEDPLVRLTRSATLVWQRLFSDNPIFFPNGLPPAPFGLPRRIRIRIPRWVVIIAGILLFVFFFFGVVPFVYALLTALPGRLLDHGFYRFDEKDKSVSERTIVKNLRRWGVGEIPGSRHDNSWSPRLGYAKDGYGANKISEVLDVIYMKDMDAKYLPQKAVPAVPEHRKRLVFIGDVHGSFDPSACFSCKNVQGLITGGALTFSLFGSHSDPAAHVD